MKELSIIIPTYNEEENVIKLVERIHTILSLYRTPYQIIFVDDHSTDTTRSLIESLMPMYPVKLFLKRGNKGKAQSLIEGFAHADYDLVCMIDADLQYPPEAIPQMIKKVVEGADVVIANRKKKQVGFLRTITSNSYNLLFNKFLHNFDFDVQSGLKVFRKEIIERLEINPSPWTFDLEFLKKSVDAGYHIDSIDIDFTKRIYGKSKINFIKSSWEIGMNALRLKFRQAEVIPFHPKRQLIDGNGFHYKGKSFIHHSSLHINEMAFFRLDLMQKVFGVLFGILLLEALLFNWHLTLLTLLIASSLLYFIDIFFNFFLIVQSFRKYPEIKITDQEIKEINDNDWPAYTILCPLYKEWHVVQQFVTAMSKLD